MSSSRHRRKTEQEWEAQKNTIKQLYIDQNKSLEGPDGVIDFMKNIQGFVASKPQYEARLRKWGFQKKISQNEWIKAGQLVATRKEAGVQSEIWCDGKRVSDIKVKKEMSRYQKQIREAQQNPCLISETPSRLNVRTPDRDPMLLVDVHAYTPIQSPLKSTLPSNQLSNSMAISNNMHLLASIDPNVCSFSPRSITSNFIHENRASSEPTTSEAEILQIEGRLIKHVRERIPESTFSLLEGLMSGVQPSRTHPLKLVAPSLDAAMSRYPAQLASRFTREVSSLPQITSLIGIAINRLLNDSSKFKIIHSSFGEVTWDVAHRPEDDLLLWFLSYLQATPRSNLQRLYECLPEPLQMAFVSNMFLVAMKEHALYTLENLVSTRADVPLSGSEMMEYFLDRSNQTPQMADMSSKTRLASRVDYYSRGNPSHGLQFSKSLWNIDSRLNLERLQILQNIPGHVSRSDIWHLRNALELGDFGLIELLLLRAHPRAETYMYWTGRQDIRQLAVNLPESFAIQVLGIIVECLLTHVEGIGYGKEYQKMASRIVDLAIILEKHQLATSLFDRGAKPGADGLLAMIEFERKDLFQHLLRSNFQHSAACLSVYVNTKNIRMVSFLVDAGVCPSLPHHGTYSNVRSTCRPVLENSSEMRMMLYHFVGQPWRDPRYSVSDTSMRTTPHAEALRVGFGDAIEIFERCVPKPYTTIHLVSLIVATAGIKSHDAMSQHLNMIDTFPNPSYDSILKEGFDHALEVATLCQNSNAIKMLLKIGAKISFLLERRMGQLIRQGDTDFVEEILDLSTDAVHSHCLLCAAIWTGDSDLVRKVLQYQTRSINISKALFDAVCTGSCDMVAILMGKDLLYDMNAPGVVNRERYPQQQDTGFRSHEWKRVFYQHTPLTLAIWNGRTGIARMLLERGADPNVTFPANTSMLDNAGYSATPAALEIACFRKDEEMISILIDHGADCRDPMTLYTLTMERDLVLLQKLLDITYNYCPKSEPWYLYKSLRLAIKRGDTECFTLLLKFATSGIIQHKGRGAQKDHRNATPLWAVAIDTKGSTSIEMLRYLLDLAIDVNSIYPMQNDKRSEVAESVTPLLRAVQVGSIPKIDLLIHKGASINEAAAISTLRTPLQLASDLGNTEIVSHLLRKGADVNAEPAARFGATALQLAAGRGFVAIAELLIHHGAFINAVRCKLNGRTAFEAATEHGKLDMILLLVREGADLTSEFGEQQYNRALEFAEKNRQAPAIALAKQLRETVLKAEADARKTANSLDWDDLQL